MTYRPELGYCAQGIYNRELGAPFLAGYAYRVPSGPGIEALAGPGTIVRTSYSTGPYLVVRIGGPWVYRPPEGGEFQHWSLCMVDLRDGRRRRDLDPEPDSWINEVVPVEGRLLKLFETNDDEVFVIEPPDGVRVPALQLGLAL